MAGLQDFYAQFGQNASYVRELFELYLTDPSLVGEKWARIFDALDDLEAPAVHTNGALLNGAAREAHAGDERIFRLIDAYRQRGHLKAKVNPLRCATPPALPEELDIDSYHFTAEDLSATVPCAGFAGRHTMRLSDLMGELERVYAGSIGCEIEHLVDTEARDFLRSRIESRPATLSFSPEQQRTILRRLFEAELFESELHRKYVGMKRFSLQGNDTLIAVLDRVIDAARIHNTHEVVIGMAHRGRLGVLTTIVGKPLSMLFNEFEDQTLTTVVGAGDVKYHLGHSTTVETAHGEVSVSLAPNPSHLEFVNPVLEGICRAQQDTKYHRDRRSVLPVAIHGDAAFIGQGVVYETLNLMNLPGFTTGGTLHLVANNQIGFTTDPMDSRSSIYCTDIAKGLDIPVFHVNCEDPEACCWAALVALEYRSRFGRDVIVDLIGYRRYGHNEGDDPTFTQPVMYAEIQAKKTIGRLYSDTLIAAGKITAEESAALEKSYLEHFKAGETDRRPGADGEACATHGRFIDHTPPAPVSKEQLQEIGKRMLAYPAEFTVHAKLGKILEKRVENITTGSGIDWGMAEALAFATLIDEGIPVRLSGQDAGRGTFSQRHLALSDATRPLRFVPFGQSDGDKAKFDIINSSLSEAGVVGFEFGYAATAPRTLTIWEAQFGDFSNGAQVIIDQFISSSESKWGQLSGVVLMLPHGFEGQGPEHSSARLERYLQLCAEGNMTVCYPTTAAQHFHLLRQHASRSIRRPLIIMTPKSLLRLAGAASTVHDLTTSSFRPIIIDDLGGGGARNVILLSGKVFYDVLSYLQKNPPKEPTRIVRVEQLYPFPSQEILAALKGAKKIAWVQEEPRNMGSWNFMLEQLTELSLSARYIGRHAAASPATGSSKHHATELAQLLGELGGFLG